MRKSVITMAVVLVLLLGASARAELITIQIEAIVDSVVDNGPGTGFLNGQVSAGNTITGYYIYESTTPDQDWLWGDVSPTVGRYHHFASPAGIFLTVGGLNFQTDTSSVNFLIGITNNGPAGDGYGVESFVNLPLSFSTVDYIFWGLTDSDGSVFSSDALPSNPPILSDWQYNGLCIKTDRAFEIKGHVTSIIPEPGTFLVLLTGTIFLRSRK